MRKTLVLAGALLALLAAGLALAGAPDDVNAISDDAAGVNDTTSPRRQQPEVSIAIDPTNPSIIAAGAQDFRRAVELRAACGGDRWNGLYLSTNGGNTWSNSLVPGFCTDDSDEADDSEMFGLSTNTDPVLVFDAFGNLYYSHIAFNANPFQTVPPSASGVIYVSFYDVDGSGAEHVKTVKIPSGAGLRQAPFEVGPGVTSNFDDKQWMAADGGEDDSPHYGRVYVTWTKFSTQGGQSSIWMSHCGGDSPGDACVDDEFSRGRVINRPIAGGLVQESFPDVAPNGDLYVAFLQFQGGFGSTLPHSGVWLLKSADGGDTFTQRKIADITQIPNPIPPATASANDPSGNSFRIGTAPGVAVDGDGTVHVVWGEWNGTDADVKYVRSTDGGDSWSGPIDMAGAAGHQFFPSVAAAQDEVHVVWYDSRNDPPGGGISALDVFYNRSLNNGASFEADGRVTDESFNPNAVSRFPDFCAAFIGDYIDIDAVDDTVAAIWTDNRKVGTALTPTECATFRADSTAASAQSRLNDGSLDQEAFVDVIEQ